jgi:ubiquinone/menaquinone biosynthesis C-methylase UbiE
VPGAVLDAGCGDGALGRDVGQATGAASVVGPDLSVRRALRAGTKAAAVSFTSGSISDLPFADGRFDLVLGTDLLAGTCS